MKSDPPKKSSAGLYAVSRFENFIYWEAWRSWYLDALGKGFFPAIATVFLEFPPETQEAANFVAAQINEIRRVNKWALMVPERPTPWRRWTPTEMNRRELIERQSFANDNTVSAERAQAVIEAARNRYFPKKKRVFEEQDEAPKRGPTLEEEMAYLDRVREIHGPRGELPRPTHASEVT